MLSVKNLSDVESDKTTKFLEPWWNVINNYLVIFLLAVAVFVGGVELTSSKFVCLPAVDCSKNNTLSEMKYHNACSAFYNSRKSTDADGKAKSFITKLTNLPEYDYVNSECSKSAFPRFHSYFSLILFGQAFILLILNNLWLKFPLTASFVNSFYTLAVEGYNSPTDHADLRKKRDATSKSLLRNFRRCCSNMCACVRNPRPNEITSEREELRSQTPDRTKGKETTSESPPSSDNKKMYGSSNDSERDSNSSTTAEEEQPHGSIRYHYTEGTPEKKELLSGTRDKKESSGSTSAVTVTITHSGDDEHENNMSRNFENKPNASSAHDNEQESSGDEQESSGDEQESSGDEQESSGDEQESSGDDSKFEEGNFMSFVNVDLPTAVNMNSLYQKIRRFNDYAKASQRLYFFYFLQAVSQFLFAAGFIIFNLVYRHNLKDRVKCHRIGDEYYPVEYDYFTCSHSMTNVFKIALVIFVVFLFLHWFVCVFIVIWTSLYKVYWEGHYTFKEELSDWNVPEDLNNAQGDMGFLLHLLHAYNELYAVLFAIYMSEERNELVKTILLDYEWPTTKFEEFAIKNKKTGNIGGYYLTKAAGIPKTLYQLGKCKEIEILYFEECRLQAADYNGLRTFSLLDTLFIEQCSLREIPKELFKLTKLRSLSLARNSITCVPEDISQLEKLNVFYIGHNELRTVHKSITELPNLNKISLQGNKYIDLELINNVLDCPHLEKLYIYKGDYSDLEDKLEDKNRDKLKKVEDASYPIRQNVIRSESETSTSVSTTE